MSTEDIGYMRAKLEAIEEKIDVGMKRMDNHSQRLAALELWRSFLAGMQAVALAGLAVLGVRLK